MGGPSTAGGRLERPGSMRLAMLLETRRPRRRPPLAVVPVGDAAEAAALGVLQSLRAAGVRAEMAYRGNLRRRMERANRIGARAAVILGLDDIAAGVGAGEGPGNRRAGGGEAGGYRRAAGVMRGEWWSVEKTFPPPLEGGGLDLREDRFTTEAQRHREEGQSASRERNHLSSLGLCAGVAPGRLWRTDPLPPTPPPSRGGEERRYLRHEPRPQARPHRRPRGGTARPAVRGPVGRGLCKGASKELSELAPVEARIGDLRAAEQAQAEAETMLADPEMRELAEAELHDLKDRITTLAHEIRLAAAAQGRGRRAGRDPGGAPCRRGRRSGAVRGGPVRDAPRNTPPCAAGAASSWNTTTPSWAA